MQQHYELMLVVTPTIDDKGVEAITGKVIDLISHAGGRVTRQEILGRRKLAYEIKHEHFGIYVLIAFDIESREIKVFETKLKLMHELIRFLVLKMVPRKQIKPAPRSVAEPKQAPQLFPGEQPVEPTAKRDYRESKISLEDLDKKLDEILKEDV